MEANTTTTEGVTNDTPTPAPKAKTKVKAKAPTKANEKLVSGIVRKDN